jgi:hypothetical protein
MRVSATLPVALSLLCGLVASSSSATLPTPREGPSPTSPDRESTSTTTASRTRAQPHDPAAGDGPLAALLDGAGKYVRRYPEDLRGVVAEEVSKQWLRTDYSSGGSSTTTETVARTWRAELVTAATPGPLPWETFRDVVEVDGVSLGDREGRLARLLGAASPDALAEAQRMQGDNSRYNLGAFHRSVSLPTLALLLLLPENQERLDLTRGGERTIAGRRSVEVEFREVATPTLVHDDRGRDVPSSGRFWIDPSSGAVLRSEVDYELPLYDAQDVNLRQRGYVVTEYRAEPGFDVLVPNTMRELWTTPMRVEATARYPRYRRACAD